MSVGAINFRRDLFFWFILGKQNAAFGYKRDRFSCAEINEFIAWHDGHVVTGQLSALNDQALKSLSEHRLYAEGDGEKRET